MITPDDTDGESGEIQYSVQPGVFKRFCERAERPAVRVDADYGISDSPSIWKVSLEGTGDNPTRTECLKITISELAGTTMARISQMKPTFLFQAAVWF